MDLVFITTSRMTSSEQKKIRAMAKLLPETSYITNERVEIKGEDLLLSGQKEVEGKEIEPDKIYCMKAPVYNEANHYRRMKRAFGKNGRDGIKAYLNLFSKTKIDDFIDILFPN